MSEAKKELPRRLTDEQLAEILREDVLPPLARIASQDSPRMVLLGGPQGSRKTTLRSVVADQLEMGPDVVFYDGDDHNVLHPHYDALAREHGALEASRLCGPDLAVLRTAILNEIQTRRLHVMFVGPYTDQKVTLERVASFRGIGYRTEMAYTALHPALSQLGGMYRHHQALADGPGYSFLVSLELQQAVFDNTPKILTRVEGEALADALHIVDAGGIAFSKEYVSSSWTPDEPIAVVLERTRYQPWDSQTRQDFTQRRPAVATPAGESAEAWAVRLARVDELAAPMLAAPAAGQRPSVQAARRRSTNINPSAAAKKAAPPTAPHRPATPPAPGFESSSGRSR